MFWKTTDCFVCVAWLAVSGLPWSVGQSSDFRVLRRIPHDTGSFTQGLAFGSDDILYESTGLWGASSVLQIGWPSGRVIRKRQLDPGRFGEGATVLDERLFQLTWSSGVGYIYDLDGLVQSDTFLYEGEGWGLATDGQFLILSDGTSRLRWLDPRSLAVVRNALVSWQGEPVTGLNELEYARGSVYANVYGRDSVARIDPVTGNVVRWYDLTALRPDVRQHPSTGVLNGIAFSPSTETFLITGKRWPYILEVDLLDAW